jgi:hypothetical protein
MKLIDGIVPPNGFHFPEGDVILRGDSVPHLVSVIEAYRAENGIPYKDVEPEIYEYFCSRWPYFCQFYDTEQHLQKPFVSPVAEPTLLNDLQSWSAAIINQQNAPLMVSGDVAEARAEICKRCDNDVRWKSGCGSCINAVERTTAAIRSARDTTTSKRLGACKVMRHCNRTAVWLDKTAFLNPAQPLPSACWLNQ